MNSIIHLAIAFDKNYLLPFYALLTSIIKNNRDNKIIIHAIISDISDDELKMVHKYATDNYFDIKFYNIHQQKVDSFVTTGTWTKAVYYRLYFPLLLSSEIKKLLYIDTDILVIKDLSELYNTELDGYPVGAVYDNWVKTAPYLGIHDENKYFNSGMLLIDVDKWREQKISEKAFEFLEKYPERIRFVDQDALNAVLINNWKKLDNRFNFMYSLIPEGISKIDLKDLVKDKVIIHFTLQRPWQLLCRNRLRSAYFYYLNQSPAKKQKKIIDFEWHKLKDLLILRAQELYYDMPLVQKYWKKIKAE